MFKFWLKKLYSFGLGLIGASQNESSFEIRGDLVVRFHRLGTGARLRYFAKAVKRYFRRFQTIEPEFYFEFSGEVELIRHYKIESVGRFDFIGAVEKVFLNNLDIRHRQDEEELLYILAAVANG